jgi:uncharacterized membrane protein YfcA
MHLHDFALSIAAFLSEILGTISGFGSSTFFVPAASYFEKFQFVLALTAILHLFANSSRIFLFREHFDLKLFAKMALPSVLLTGAGALLSNQVPSDVLQKGLGFVLILVSLIFLIGKFRFKHLPISAAVILSGLSGFTTGLVGTGGAIRGVALATLNVERGAFVVLSSAIDFGGDFLRMVVYLKYGYMDWNQWFYIPILGVMAFLGSRVGKHILVSIKQEHFEKTVALFILGSGIAMLF